jgi:ferredoxin
MRIDTAELIFFSPTGTTRAVLDAVAQGLDADVSVTDLTLPGGEPAPGIGSDGTLAVIGVPVYAGRVPEQAAARLRKSLHGDGRPAVLVVVYGNRAFEDALLELRDLARDLGFVPVAGAAFVGEHSFSTPDRPVAQGRPDALDREKAHAFGRAVRDLLAGAAGMSDLPTPQVPGNFPYRQGVQPAPISPETDAGTCVLCGECATVCPTGAIVLRDETVVTDKDACLRCCACTRICPTGARVMDDQRILDLGRMLFEKFARRAEPEFFF